MTGLVILTLIACAISAATGIAIVYELARDDDERAARKAEQLDDDTMAMLDRWKDEPGIIPDALDRDLARLLAEGDKRNG